MAKNAADEQSELHSIALQAGKVFTPTAPVDERALFAGRTEQLRQIIDAVHQKGQHAIIYGERGVGKTSLANVLPMFFAGDVMTPRYNCSGEDTLDSVWRTMLGDIQMSVPAAGFAPSEKKSHTFSEALPETLSPDGLRRAIGTLAKGTTPVFVIDEFDRLGEIAKRAFADLVKSLSDHAVPATIILVGVADSVDQLIKEHQSVERALIQIQMPRMSPAEIKEIITIGFTRLRMNINEPALEHIVLFSQGLPRYAHLIGLNAIREAADQGTRNVTVQVVDKSITKALEGVQMSIRSAWTRAVSSPRKDNLFSEVLLSCALAKTDELGFFAAQDVREPMRAIAGKPYDIPSFAQHLNEFSEEKRGSILQKAGRKRHFRYRFSNPLMQPFVIMQGFSRGALDDKILRELAKPKLAR